MKGSKYAVSVVQLEDKLVLHLDAHTFFMKTMQQEQRYVIAAIMTQITLKERFKEWVTKYHNAAKSNLEQLNLRDMLKPMHWE